MIRPIAKPIFRFDTILFITSPTSFYDSKNKATGLEEGIFRRASS